MTGSHGSVCSGYRSTLAEGHKAWHARAPASFHFSPQATLPFALRVPGPLVFLASKKNAKLILEPFHSPLTLSENTQVSHGSWLLLLIQLSAQTSSPRRSLPWSSKVKRAHMHVCMCARTHTASITIPVSALQFLTPFTVWNYSVHIALYLSIAWSPTRI